MTITASLVKELRERTGAGMMDCKTALAETDGNFDAAVDVLRKKGLAAVAKKSGRVAAEGLIGVAVDGTKGAIVEINAETDFVARNEIFQKFVEEVSEIALSTSESDLKNASMKNGKTVDENLTENIAVIGEKQTFRRSAQISVNDGVIASYIHTALTPSTGKVGVLVALESEGDKNVLKDLGKKIAMHVAAAKPQFCTDQDVDPAVIEKERVFLTEQALEEGKKPEIVEKMISGRLQKFKKEIVLEHQIFVIDGESKISKIIADTSKEIGADIKLKAFVSFILGEGIEKKEENFAEEVAKTMGQG